MSEINAVEMTRRIRDSHFEQLQGKSPQEAMAFFREKAESVHALLRKGSKAAKEESEVTPSKA